MTDRSTPIRRLGNRYPCCGDRCRYDLELGVARQVVCPRCGRPFRALLVPGTPHARLMAGQPVGKVRFEPVSA